MNFNFGEVLSRAWQIIWKHKVLWIFGILAGCSRGGSSLNWNSGSSDGGFGGGTPNLPPQMLEFFAFLAENIVSIAVIVTAVICIFWILAIFLGTIGKIGLIRGTWQAEAGENMFFGQLFSQSLPYFWRIFGLSLLVSLPFVIVIGGLIASALVFGAAASLGSDESAIGFLALLPFFFGCMCLLLPVGIVINMIVRQSERVIVLEDSRVLPALSRGWDIFRSNLGPIILMSLILWVISLVVGFIIAIPILIIVLPATIAFVAGGAENWNPLIFAFACACLYAPLTWVINGIAVAYAESAWTLTYIQLVRPLDNLPAVLEANA
ncbi:MAG TPA: hypothetical protein VJ785_12045 [Anaerolineales bacterium]|nr:hypothetical protein [Anaerolineales bacterium]